VLGRGREHDKTGQPLGWPVQGSLGRSRQRKTKRGELSIVPTEFTLLAGVNRLWDSFSAGAQDKDANAAKQLVNTVR